MLMVKQEADRTASNSGAFICAVAEHLQRCGETPTLSETVANIAEYRMRIVVEVATHKFIPHIGTILSDAEKDPP